MEFNATFIVAFISFIVFIFIMNLILYKPIDDIVTKRKNIIDDNYKEAQKNSEKKEAVLKEREDKLSSAKEASRKETQDAILDANNTKNTKIATAKAEARTDIEKNKEIINQEKNNSIEVLKSDVIELAQLISDKILKSHEKIEENDNEFIESLIQG